MSELKPCPFCGGIGPIYRSEWRAIQCRECLCMPQWYGDYRPNNEGEAWMMWNRRTPDLTEALARLKVVEGEMRKYSTSIVEYFRWADEIAAIRKAMGASDAGPKPAPKP